MREPAVNAGYDQTIKMYFLSQVDGLVLDSILLIIIND